MKLIPLANTDLLPSTICLGTGTFGTDISRDDSFAILDAFLEARGTFLDTANIYGDWASEVKGMSERTIGEWLASRRCRDRVIIATKGGHPILGTQISRLSPEEISDDLRESLRRLKIERIDLLWLHRDDPARPVGEILETLESARREGLIGWYAASNWTSARLAEAAEYSKTNSIPGMVASQIQWSLVKMNPEGVFDSTMVEMDDEVFQYHLGTELPVVAYTSQASGFFSGRYLRDDPESGRPEVRRNYGSDANWGRLNRARDLAREIGCTPNQIALAYLINQPFLVYPIAGCRSVDQVADSCAAADIVLTPEQVDWLKTGY